MSYYAVHKGHIPGIYRSWPECQKQIAKFKGAVYKKFSTSEEATEFLENGKIVVPNNHIYADGSCDFVAKAAGSGVFFGDNDPRNISDDCVPGDQTNQRAELYALLLALKTLKDNSSEIIIFTDSLYSIKTSTKVYNANENLDILNEIWKEMVRVGPLVTFQHVYGHQGRYGNEGANTLAKNAMLRRRSRRG